MAQQLVTKPHNKANATLGGMRLIIKETKSNSPGFNFFGNVHSPNFESLVEFFEHYSAASGRNVKDYDIVAQLGYKIGFTTDEMLLATLRRYFFASEHTDVAANATDTSAAETWYAGKTGSQYALQFGQQTSGQRTALTVYNVTDSAALVENTDYKKTTVFGWTVIEMLVDTHAGDTLRVGVGGTSATAYNWNRLASRKFVPLSQPKIEGSAILLLPASNGANLGWRIPSVVLKPDGSLDWKAKEASSVKFTLEILDDSVNNPTEPFGSIDFYGYDDAGVPLL